MKPQDPSQIYKQQIKSQSPNQQLNQMQSPVFMKTLIQSQITQCSNEVVPNGISMVDVVGGVDKSELIIIPMSQFIQNKSLNVSNEDTNAQKIQEIKQKQQIQTKKGYSFYEKKQPQKVRISGFSLHKTPDQSNNKLKTSINHKIYPSNSSNITKIAFFQNNKPSNRSARDNRQNVNSQNEAILKSYKGYLSQTNISPISKRCANHQQPQQLSISRKLEISPKIYQKPQQAERSKLSNSISNLFSKTYKLNYSQEIKNSIPINQLKTENKRNSNQIDSNGCFNSNDNSFLKRSPGIQGKDNKKDLSFFNSATKNNPIHSSLQTKQSTSSESPSFWTANKENSYVLGNQQDKQSNINMKKEDFLYSSSPSNSVNISQSTKQVGLAYHNFFSKFIKKEDRNLQHKQLENVRNISNSQDFLVDRRGNESNTINSQLNSSYSPSSSLLANAKQQQNYQDPANKPRTYLSFASLTTIATSQQSNFRFSENNQGQENLKLDQTPNANELSTEPLAYQYVCKEQKSILYDQIIPTFKPILKQTKIQNWKKNSNGGYEHGRQIDNFTANNFQDFCSTRKEQISSEILNYGRNTSKVLEKSTIMKMTNFSDLVEENNTNNKLFLKALHKDSFKKTHNHYNHQASEQYQLQPFVQENDEEIRTQNDNFSFSNFINQQKDSLDRNQQINGGIKHPQETTTSNKANTIIESFSQMQNQQESESSEVQDNEIVQGQTADPLTTVNGILWVSSQQVLELEESESNDINRDIQSCLSNKRLVQGMWCLEQFEFGKSLGKGRYGVVYLARQFIEKGGKLKIDSLTQMNGWHKPSNILVAIKQIHMKSLRDHQMEQQLQQEIKIQSFCNHPNILKMYGFFQEDSQIHLILELAAHGDIYKEKKQQKLQWFSEKKAADYIRQVCEGLIYLHSQGIIHRDIKPENILNSYGVLKISDFGWSVFSKEKRTTFCGTLDYVSPEVIAGNLYDCKVDVWSIGVLTYELLTGKAPFENKDKEGNYSQAYSNILEVNYEFPSYVSLSARQFITCLLTSDPSQRISLEQALNHPWILSNTHNSLGDWDSSVSQQILQLLS